MTKRAKRIERLVEHRERALDDRVEQLQATRLQAEAAHARARHEQEQLRAAAEHKSRLLAGGLQAGDWAEAQRWMEDSARRWAKARGEALGADAKVREAQSEVLDARSDLKRLEVLGERLSAAVRREAEAAEQKTTDEHAMRRRGAEWRKGEPS